MTLLELYGVIGFRQSGMVHDQAGKFLGYSNLRGSQCHYYDPQGRSLGYAERGGGDLILRTPGGQTVERFRARG